MLLPKNYKRRPCLNKHKAFQSKEELSEKMKQQYKQNHDKMLEKITQYRDKNRDELNAKRRERVCCPHCDKEISKYNLLRHEKICKKNLTIN